MKRYLHLCFSLLFAFTASAQTAVYQKYDSLKVMKLLQEAPAGKSSNGYMDWVGHQLVGIPYVAKTLDNEKKECLVVNLRQLDCTTFTENCLALTLCLKNNRKTFTDFTRYLRLVRYEQGKVTYDKRSHYFTSWIDDNSRLGFVSEVNNGKIFSGKQKLNINFMTTHASLYPQLSESKSLTDSIRKTEKSLTGRTFSYIPKASLKNYTLLKKSIKTGDIIVILTSKKGLDTSHIGIASWHKDGTLHLMNASQIHKKVVDEPMTLYDYMRKHPSQIGIRVVRAD